MLRPRPLMLVLFWLILGSAWPSGTAAAEDQSADERMNVLIITVDDMSADSVGVFDCPVPGTTPNIDALARRGLRFDHAHVQVGNCMPGRNVMWSGLYPHNNGVEGFYQVPGADHPHLVDVMKAAGYFTAIRGKVRHSTPYTPYGWDEILETDADGERAHPKDAASYGHSVRQGIEAAEQADRPFCVMVNISDPHKPFYAQHKRTGKTIPDPHKPSRVFTAEDVVVPGFLFDDPVVRKELGHYYCSVRRADDCVGQVLTALQESGQAENTLILFLSDHGMALPFAKTQVYHHSSHTPLIVSVPGVTKPDSVDSEHMVSAVDLLPTLVELTGIEQPLHFDGRSFAPVIRGEQQSGRDFVIKEYNENAGGSRDPMRAIQTKQYLYIFNPWSNGERVMKTATTGTPTYRRMKELAQTDPQIARRHELYQHRVVEELYDVSQDPDCVNNLIDDPQVQDDLQQLRETLEEELERTRDPLLAVFRRRDDAEARETYVRSQEIESAQRQAEQRRERGGQRAQRGRRNRRSGKQ